jgi:hypothetical protein
LKSYQQFFPVADLTSLSFFHDEKFGYATAEMIATRVITTNNSKRVKPLMS